MPRRLRDVANGTAGLTPRPPLPGSTNGVSQAGEGENTTRGDIARRVLRTPCVAAPSGTEAAPERRVRGRGRSGLASTIVLLALTLFAAPLAAQPEGVTPSGLTFHASFEDGLDADFAAGGGAATPEGAPEIVEGHSGRGLAVGDLGGSAGVWYPAPGNFSLERGSISMWVQPVNWRGDERGNRLFLNARPDPAGLLCFYKYTNTTWGLTLLVDPDGTQRSKTYAYQQINDWEPGQWHHIAATWCRYEGVALYIDGEQVVYKAGSGLAEGPVQERMRFGGSWDSDGNRTVIDEIMIFDRMLAPYEIAAIAAEAPVEPPAITELDDIPGVMLTHAYLDRVVLARVYADAPGERIAQSARLSLTPVNGDRPVRSVSHELKRDGVNQFTLDLNGLDHGDYVARVSLIADDAVVAAEALDVRHEVDSTWTQARALGRADRVLKPFEALRLNGSEITVAERRYTLGEGGMLAGALAGAEQLLAGPVRLIATTADGEMQTRTSGLTMDALSDTTAIGTGTLIAGGLSATTEVTARYDGTLWTELGIVTDRDLRLTGLRVEVPLRPEVAKYLCWWAPRWIDARRWGYGALPEGEGTVWSREFMPSLWIGDEERGIGWYAESDEGWDLAEEGMLTIERRPEATVLSMNVIREPRALTGPLRIAFGLQATPVRALADDWRSYQWVPSADISRFFLGLRDRPWEGREIGDDRPRGKVCYLYTHHKHFTNTLPRDPEEFREMIARAKDYGLFTTPYTEARLMPEDRGDFILHDEEMPILPWVRTTSYGAHSAVGCCMRGPFSDWLVWYCTHMIDEYGTNGVYFDELQPLPCMNEAHGCGYVGADGERHPTYPMRDYLETMRRIRTVFEETGEPYRITYHISAGRTAPMPTFADDLLMAEERNPVVGRNPDYTENTTPEEWLASFAPEAWGIPPVVLPQFKMNAEWMRDPALAHTLMAAVVPHDLLVWPVFADTETIMGLRTRLMEFGIGEPDTRFIGYWEADAPVRCDDERVKCSAYVRPGKVLLCIGNWSDEAIAGLPVRLDLEALGLPVRIEARNAMTGESVAVEEGIAHPDLEPKRLTLVEINGG